MAIKGLRWWYMMNSEGVKNGAMEVSRHRTTDLEYAFWVSRTRMAVVTVKVFRFGCPLEWK